MGALDTDCNAATVGSILGVMLGAKALPASWTAPLQDTLLSGVDGFGRVKISDMARARWLSAHPFLVDIYIKNRHEPILAVRAGFFLCTIGAPPCFIFSPPRLSPDFFLSLPQ